MMDFFKTKFYNFTSTVGERNEVDQVVQIALFLQKLFGQQVLDPRWTWKRVSHQLILNILLFIYVFIGTFQTLQVTSDTELIAESCYVLIMIAAFPIKLLLFVNNRYIFRELFITMKGTLLDSIKQRSDLQIVIKNAKRILFIFFVMGAVPIVNHEILAIWNYLKGTLTPISRVTSTLMPMKFPYYQIAWVLHSIFLVSINTTLILDMWFVLLVFFLCAASDSLENVLKVDQRKCGETYKAYQKRLNESLKEFYNNHVVQIEFLSKVNKMYKWLSFVPLCNAATCVCIIMLIFSKDLNWKFAPHILPMMFAEIFAYNYFGEQIKSKSSQMNKALQNFDWTNLELKDKKCYYIIITFMQKEFGIKTGIGNYLSLVTMTSILQITYRAFTMLQSI